MKSGYQILAQFDQAQPSYKGTKHFNLNGDQIISFFEKVNQDPSTYTETLVDAQEGNVIALAAMGAYFYKNNDKKQAIAIFDRVVECASQNCYLATNVVSSLRYALATFIDDPYMKGKYYHAAILAGDQKSFRKLAFCLDGVKTSADYHLGLYYAMFALNLADQAQRDRIIQYMEKHHDNSWKPLLDEKQSFSLYQAFQKDDPAEFKKLFIQYPATTIQRGIRDYQGNYTRGLFKQYQDELVGDVLKEALQLQPRGACFSDDVEKVLENYQGKYHAEYFVNFENLLKNKINEIEEKVVPVCLGAIENMTNYRIKELLNEIIKLCCTDQTDKLVVNNENLSVEEEGFYTQILNAHPYLFMGRNQCNDSKRNDELRTSFLNPIIEAPFMKYFYKKKVSDIQDDKVKSAFLELQSCAAVREALCAPESKEDVIVFRSRPLPSAPDQSVGPEAEHSYPALRVDSRGADERITISKTKKFANVAKKIHEESERLKRIANQDNRTHEWDLGAMMAAVLSGGVLYMGLLAALSLPQMACLAGVCVLTVGLINLISNYTHPIAAGVRYEKKGAREALGFFEKQMVQNNNVKPAYTLPTVRAHL